MNNERKSRIGRPAWLRFFALAVVVPALFLPCLPSANAQVSVTTNRNDNARDGLNSSETILTPSNVNASSFGKVFSFPVDGFIVSQPLYLPNLGIPAQGTHNVVFVATQHDSVYAFDADGNTTLPLWQATFINSANGVTTVPIADQGCPVVNGYTEVGIIGTPVIDSTTKTLYVVAKTKEVVGGTTTYYFRLHALDVTTGAEKFGGPVPISASYTAGGNTVTLNILNHFQRPGLVLTNGQVYVAFGSNGCDFNAYGWLLSYSASTLQQLGVFAAQTMGTYGSSLWQSGVAPAADSSGNIYLSSANGVFDANTGGPDYGDSIIKFGAGTATATDYFTPFDQNNLALNDRDLGSGGPTLLPDQSGANPHLLVANGKGGNLYLVNRDNLGQYNSTSNSQIVQYVTGATGELYGNAAYWNGYVYYAGRSDNFKAFSLTNGQLSTTAMFRSAKIFSQGLPSISANGASNGIVWLIRTVKTAPVLSGYAALGLNELYNSNTYTRDNLGNIAHFATPTVVAGRVYTPAQTQLVVYGLFPVMALTSGNLQTANVGTVLPQAITTTAQNVYTGAAIPGITVTFSDGNKGGKFSTTTAVTDSNGLASTTYTLPTLPGSYGVTAEATNFTTGTFSETALAGPPSTLAVVSGGKQKGTVGTTLPAGLVFRVKDVYGNVVPGVTVTATDSGAGGSFAANPLVTNSNGQVSFSYTLPTKAGSPIVKGSAGSLSTTLSEQAVAAAPAIETIVSGNNQTATHGKVLPRALVVSVTDQYGNGNSGITVTFSDNGAGGTFSNTSPVTNTSGQVSVTYTTGQTPGTISITATTTGLTPVTFTETVQ